MGTALATLMSLPAVALPGHTTPVLPLSRLAASLGPDSPRLYAKRDDLLSFALGGNKVRKMQTVAAEAIAAGADTLITCGGVQSNHARVTAAAGAALGMQVHLVANGVAPDPPTGNARLNLLFGATMHYVSSREERAPEMDRLAADLRAAGRKPFVIPLGASTPTGAMGFARGVTEIAAAGIRPDVIVHASSSGGTQAGLVAGCALVGLSPRIIGVSADDPASALSSTISGILAGIADRLGAKPSSVGADRPLEIDDSEVGEGYGIPTPSSTAATELVARREGIVLDQTYGAKAMASLVRRIRSGELTRNQTVLFWVTGMGW